MKKRQKANFMITKLGKGWGRMSSSDEEKNEVDIEKNINSDQTKQKYAQQQ